MKKLRYIALLICTVLCLVTLGGCEMLDDMRKLHAVYVDGSDYEHIEFDGCTYKFMNTEDTGYRLGDHMTAIYATDSDVPLLLIGLFGDGAHLSSDKKIISCIGEDSGAYVREDVYDTVEKEIHGGMEYISLGAALDYDEYYNFSQSEYKSVMSLIESETITVVSDYASDKSFKLYLFSESGVFSVDFGELAEKDGKYRLYLHRNGSAIFESLNVPDDVNSVVVDSTPETDKIFEKLFKKEKSTQL